MSSDNGNTLVRIYYRKLVDGILSTTQRRQFNYPVLSKKIAYLTIFHQVFFKNF